MGVRHLAQLMRTLDSDGMTRVWDQKPMKWISGSLPLRLPCFFNLGLPEVSGPASGSECHPWGVARSRVPPEAPWRPSARRSSSSDASGRTWTPRGAAACAPGSGGWGPNAARQSQCGWGEVVPGRNMSWMCPWSNQHQLRLLKIQVPILAGDVRIVARNVFVKRRILSQLTPSEWYWHVLNHAHPELRPRIGIFWGLQNFSFAVLYAVTLWFGGHVLIAGRMKDHQDAQVNGGDVIVVLIALITGMTGISTFSGYAPGLFKARVRAELQGSQRVTQGLRFAREYIYI